ncbi:methyltransferase family protein [Mycobacterium intracellulare]|uniref:methyltransferase family protein n=1 Tax=Mycobacterium intracellulare TaxID=1767 RepID=UPI000C7BDD25|nr:isoprenylcysteine carboxylmethyltransferase family protein [Mycobacterium intracellulare]
MAIAALALYFIYVALGFGWRSWRHYRATGSTGFRGINGRPGSLEWLAGVAFLVALGAGAAAPVLQLVDVLAPLNFLHTWGVQVTGTLLAIVGIAVTMLAQRDMGASWRIGADPNEKTTLIRHGPFMVVRNPIFTAMLIFAAGITLMAPNPLAIAGFALLSAAINVQVRRVEEPYLLSAHGETYRHYTRTVGRFLPETGVTRTLPCTDYRPPEDRDRTRGLPTNAR